ncbi:MAG: DUF2474 family protein [Duganella sp.]
MAPIWLPSVAALGVATLLRWPMRFAGMH